MSDVISPLQGHVCVGLFSYVGTRPYAMLFDPDGVVNALKGLYILAQGLAPVEWVSPFQTALKGRNIIA